MVESAFSAIKRIFGEHVLAKNMQNMVKELMIKACFACVNEPIKEINCKWCKINIPSC